MKFVYVLEDEPQIQKDIFDAIKRIDQKIQVRIFSDLEQVYAWMHLATESGPLALALGGSQSESDLTPKADPTSEDELCLVVAKNELIESFSIDLIRKIRDFLIRKKMCSEENPTSLVVTTHDSPTFNITAAAERRVVNNVIFKPFDKLILQQHLEFALVGRHPHTPTNLASLDVDITIDVINDLKLKRVSEVGFSFIASNQLDKGTRSRFYHEIFETTRHKSVIGHCRSSTKIGPREFLCEFDFLCLKTDQISKVRRSIYKNQDHSLQLLKKTSSTPFRVLILDKDLASNLHLKNILNDSIENLEAYSYTSIGQLLSDLRDFKTPNLKTLPPYFDLVLGDYKLFEVEKEERWNKIAAHLSDRAVRYQIKNSEPPDLFLTSKKKISSQELLHIGTWVRDIFLIPLNQSYALRKLAFLYPHLVCKNDISLAIKEVEGPLKVAHPAQALQISEAGVIVRYDFGLQIGDFRRFSLWRGDSIPYSEILGTVNFTEEKVDEKGFLNHFVFFGIRDKQLKNLRIWMRENYVKEKKSALRYI